MSKNKKRFKSKFYAVDFYKMVRITDCSAHLKVAGSDVRTPQYMTSRGLSMHN